MQKILTYLLLSSLTVIGACASTTQMEPDGQTHWMTSCDENADCGELSCICGVCTELCTASDECSVGDDIEASCQRSDSVLNTRDCSLAQAAARVCVPLCEGQSDCNGVASDLTCTTDDVCAVDERQVIEIDGSVPMDQDATVEERDPPPVTGPITPIELACDEDGNLDGDGPFEVLASAEHVDALAIAPDGTVYGIGAIDGAYGRAFQLVDGEVEVFGVELWDLQHMMVVGDQMIVAKSDGWEITISQIDLETGDKLTLAIQEGNNALAMAVDDDAVYWLTDVEQLPEYRNQLWRSPRVPGESTLLAESTGDIGWDSVVVIGDGVFFLGADAGELELYRVEKDGSSSGIEANEVPATTSILLGDGEDLYFAMVAERDPLGNPIKGSQVGIMRMDGVARSTEQLFDTGAEEPAAFIRGGDYLYWATVDMPAESKPISTLWRGHKNGGSAQQLGTVNAFVERFAEHDGTLYFSASCRIGNDGTTKSHIVRETE